MSSKYSKNLKEKKSNWVIKRSLKMDKNVMEHYLGTIMSKENSLGKQFLTSPNLEIGEAL